MIKTFDGPLLTIAGEFSPEFWEHWKKHARSSTPRLLNYLDPYRVHIALIPDLVYVIKAVGLPPEKTVPYAIVCKRWQSFEVEFTTARGYRAFLAGHGLRYAVPPPDLKRLLASGKLQDPE